MCDSPTPPEGPVLVQSFIFRHSPMLKLREPALPECPYVSDSDSDEEMDESEGNSSRDSIELGPAGPPHHLVTPRINNINSINIRETPLSTKREMSKMTPRYKKPFPKVIKTAPPVRTMYTHRDYMPRLITPKGLVPLTSPRYSSHIKTTYFEQMFHFEELVGRGSYGEVFAARSYEDSREYAVKVSIALMRPNCTRKLREAENHMLANGHPNIVELKKAWEEGGRLYIQTELCEMSLLAYCSAKHILSESELWNIFIDLLNGVHHLHELDMIHDDIKPENIFLTKDLVCKLGDFGLCINLKNPLEVKSAEEGDSKYLAVEVLNGKPTKASDVFSIGMTILEAATDLDLPSSGEAWHQIRNGAIPERFFVGINSDMRHLIAWMLEHDPNARPTTAELLEFPAIKSRLLARRIFVNWCKARDQMFGAMFVVLTWCMAFLSVIFHHPKRLFQAVSDRRSAIAAQISSQPPTQQHTPIQTPEGTKAFAESLVPTSPFDYSDDENPTNHYQRRLFPSAQPIARLNFDDDDEQATSSWNSSAIDDTSSSPIRMRHDFRHGTPKSARKIFVQPKSPSVHGGSGDFGQAEQAALKQAKYQRMMQMERHLDSDDNDNQINEAPVPMSCPPSLLRNGRRPLKMPTLNFGLLDDEEPKKPSEPVVDSPRKSLRTRRGPLQRVPIRARMMSFQGSSGDEI